MCSVIVSVLIFTLFCTTLVVGQGNHSQDLSNQNQNQDQVQNHELTSGEDIYEKCGTETGCFGIPPQCVRSRSCRAVVTFKRIDDDNFKLQLMGKVSSLIEGKYVAVGFSKDQKMGTDSVIGCFVNSSKMIQVDEFINLNDTNWSEAMNRVSQDESPINNHFGSYTDGFLHCQLTLNHLIDLTDRFNTIYDLNKDRVYLMLAKAEKGASEEQLSNHDEKGISPQPVYLSESKILDEYAHYDGCGHSKGCFALPSEECISTKNCSLFLSVRNLPRGEKNGYDFEFELVGKPTTEMSESYIAVGISHDEKMGEDSVIGCYKTASGEINIDEFFNPAQFNKHINRTGERSFGNSFTSYKDGVIHCTFFIKASIPSIPETNRAFNLLNDKIHLMLSRGQKKPANLGRHPTRQDRAASVEAISLSDKKIFKTREETPLTAITPEQTTTTIFTTASPTITTPKNTFASSPPLSSTPGNYKCKTTACFGIPHGCIEKNNCDLFASYQRTSSLSTSDPEKTLEVQLIGKMSSANAKKGYIAIGFSHDNKMGEDSVFGCYLPDGGHEHVEVGEYYNVKGSTTNKRVIRNDGKLLYTKTEVSYNDSYISCGFHINPIIDLQKEIERTFNLVNDNVFLLLARGSDATADKLNYHDTRDTSLELRSLGSLGEFSSISRPTSTYHGDYGCQAGTVGCFGLPDGCISKRTCLLFASFKRSSDPVKIFEIHLIGKTINPNDKKGYIAIAFSRDDKMGEDSVFGCYLGEQSTNVGEYYNVKGKNNMKVIRNDTAREILYKKKEGSFIDSYISCTFTINPVIQVDEIGTTFNLTRDPVFILLSRGATADSDHLGKHETNKDKGSTAEAVLLSDFEVIGAKSAILIQLHGTLMIIAWILLVPVGMYTARYFKQTFTTVTKTKAFWFWVHQICMFSAVLFTTMSIILIYIEVKEWTVSTPHTIAEMYHPILGVCVFALSFLQIFVAFLRPEPLSSKRVYFNWFHWIVGTSAWILAIVTIHLAYYLKKTNLDSEGPQYIETLYIFIVLHFTLHLIMSIHTYTADQHYDIGKKSSSRALIPGPMKPSGTSYEYKGTSLRATLLTLEILVCSIATLVLSTFIVSSLE